MKISGFSYVRNGKMNSLIKNILMVQDSSPCIRTIKIASALQSKGLNIHLAHRDRTPDEVYGYGNSSFESIASLPKNDLKAIEIIKSLIKREEIDLLHYHNQPDRLGAKLIKADLPVPVIYDQHDFMSFKHHLSKKDKKYERICNENADGTVYITDSYKNEVAKFYSLIDNSLSYANYFPSESALNSEDFLPKLSKQDKRSHLVYIGRISEHYNDHRNIIEIMKKISEKELIIHIYPSGHKKYRNYRQIKNVIIHEKLPYKDLLREISQYDFGITIFNNDIAPKLPHIRFAFGNKTYDYICAGIPVLAQECLDEVRNFTLSNCFGFILEQYENYMNISNEQYCKIVENILEKRDSFSMESQIQRMIDFYQETLEKFHAEK